MTPSKSILVALALAFMSAPHAEIKNLTDKTNKRPLASFQISLITGLGLL